jgi:hypothetical protein
MDKNIYYDAKIAKQKSLKYEFERKLDKVYEKINCFVKSSCNHFYFDDFFEDIFTEDVIRYLKQDGYKVELYKSNPPHIILSYRVSWD